MEQQSNIANKEISEFALNWYREMYTRGKKCDVGLYDSSTNVLLTANTSFLITWTLDDMTPQNQQLLLNTYFDHSTGSAIDKYHGFWHISNYQ